MVVDSLTFDGRFTFISKKFQSNQQLPTRVKISIFTCILPLFLNVFLAIFVALQFNRTLLSKIIFFVLAMYDA